MKIEFNSMDMLQTIHFALDTLDYRITGLTAVNLYGFGIDTNVFDIAVGSDADVVKAVTLLDLPVTSPDAEDYDPYIYHNDVGFYIRIQGDILGEPVIHPAGIKLHSKELLIRRLEIYSTFDVCVLKALAFIALTVDPEKTAKYKYYWNRL